MKVDMKPMSPDREARFAKVQALARKADKITSALSCQALYNDPLRAARAQKVGMRALLLMTKRVKRRRFNRRLRAYAQQLNHLEKYVPDC